MSRDFDPGEHPRWPAESSGGRGGEFRDSDGGTGWVGAVAGRIADPGFARVRQVMASRLVDSGRQRGGSMATTQLRRHADGTLIMKSYPSGERKIAREVAASHVGRALGLHVPAAVVDPASPDTLHMEWADGVLAENDSTRASGFFPLPHIATSIEGLRVGFFDSLISNGDRHTGNWLVGPDGRIIPIDHGEAMDNLWDVHSGATGEIKPKRFKHIGFSAPFRTVPGVEKPHEVWRDGNPLHPGDIPGLRTRLEALRPVFAGMGINQEYTRMMQRFEAMASRAGGTVRLFP